MNLSCKIMKGVFLKIFLLAVFVGGCDVDKRRLEPEALFVVRPGERLSVEEQGERLKYGRMLRLQVDADTIRVPTAAEVPEEYKAYAEVYACLLNRYLAQLDSVDYQMVLEWVENHSVENAVLGACVMSEEGKSTLTISREVAMRIGISEERYDELTTDIEAGNGQAVEGKMSGGTSEKGNSSAVSVFFNHAVLSMTKKTGLTKAYMADLERLKVAR